MWLVVVCSPGATCQFPGIRYRSIYFSCRQLVSTTLDLNQRGKCKPCKEQGFWLCGVLHMMGWVTFSLAERLGFAFCRYLFKRKHVWRLITAWHLTIFPDQSDKFFFFFFMLAIWRSSNKEKTYSIVTFLKLFKGSLSPQLSTSDTTSAVLNFSFYLCLFFLFFFPFLD